MTAVNYLQEVTDELDGPPCHVCGAIMVPMEKMETPDHLRQLPEMINKTWKCRSCGAHTGCT